MKMKSSKHMAKFDNKCSSFLAYDLIDHMTENMQYVMVLNLMTYVVGPYYFNNILVPMNCLLLEW